MSIEDAGDTDSYLDDWDQEWKREFEATKQKIWVAPRVQEHLGTLQQAGADASKVLSGLGIIVPEGPDRLTALFTKKQHEWAALANKLERISNDVQAAIADPCNSSAFYRSVVLPSVFTDFASTEDLTKASSGATSRTKPILDLLRTEAKLFGALRRNHASLTRTIFLRGLLSYVKESTGKFHDELMADLLQVAHEAIGINESFSAPQLRKLRQRKMPELVRTRKHPIDAANALRLALTVQKLDNSSPKNRA